MRALKGRMGIGIECVCVPQCVYIHLVHLSESAMAQDPDGCRLHDTLKAHSLSSKCVIARVVRFTVPHATGHWIYTVVITGGPD